MSGLAAGGGGGAAATGVGGGLPPTRNEGRPVAATKKAVPAALLASSPRMPPTNFSRLTSSPASWPRKACAVAVGPWAAASLLAPMTAKLPGWICSASRARPVAGVPGGWNPSRRTTPAAVGDARQTVHQALGDQALGQNVVFALDVRGGRQKERAAVEFLRIAAVVHHGDRRRRRPGALAKDADGGVELAPSHIASLDDLEALGLQGVAHGRGRGGAPRKRRQVGILRVGNDQGGPQRLGLGRAGVPTEAGEAEQNGNEASAHQA